MCSAEGASDEPVKMRHGKINVIRSKNAGAENAGVVYVLAVWKAEPI